MNDDLENKILVTKELTVGDVGKMVRAAFTDCGKEIYVSPPYLMFVSKNYKTDVYDISSVWKRVEQ